MISSSEIDKNLLPVLRQMEESGVRLDVSHLSGLEQDLKDKLADLEEKIFDSVGHPFQINSAKQVAKVLFDELNLSDKSQFRLRRTTTGLSTAAGELDKIKDAHPVVEYILQYREVGKLLSTYVIPLPLLVDGESRLHTTYAIDTASGRLSSKKPNLQNIPAKSESGQKIRRAFIAPPGRILLAADYSQIELRVIAHLADDSKMIEVFKSGGDIHASTAEALGIDRHGAKAVNFGIIYGLTSFGLSESLGVSREEAQHFIDDYFKTYPDVANYIQQLIAKVHDLGFAETMFGRRRNLRPEIDSHNDHIRRAAERMATNHPVQGTAAEIIKLAMIKINSKIKYQNAKLMLQVHDELVFEVEKDKVKEISELVREAMENVIKLKIPLIVDIKVGKNWDEMEEI